MIPEFQSIYYTSSERGQCRGSSIDDKDHAKDNYKDTYRDKYKDKVQKIQYFRKAEGARISNMTFYHAKNTMTKKNTKTTTKTNTKTKTKSKFIKY